MLNFLLDLEPYDLAVPVSNRDVRLAPRGVVHGVEERLLQEVTVGDHDQDHPDRDAGRAHPQAQAEHRPGDRLDDATPSFSFGAAGDFEFGETFKATAAAVKAENPDFLIALGDLAYEAQEEEWCNYWKQTVKYNHLVLIAGNHDSGEDSAGNINNYVKFCPFTLDSSVTGKYGKQYYFDYPAGAPLARFILVVPGLGGHFLDIDTDYSIGHPGYDFTAAGFGKFTITPTSVSFAFHPSKGKLTDSYTITKAASRLRRAWSPLQGQEDRGVVSSLAQPSGPK